MTEHKLYRCDICGTEYADKSCAISCEKFHVKPKEVKGLGWNGKNVSDFPYPLTVVIEFDDGKQLQYER